MDGKGQLYLEIKPDQDLSKAELFRILRFAKKQGASNVAIRGTKGRKLLKIADKGSSILSGIGDLTKEKLFGVDAEVNKKGKAIEYNVLTNIFDDTVFLDRHEHTSLLSTFHGFSPSGISQSNGGFLQPHDLMNGNYIGGYGDAIFSSLQGANMFLDGNYTEYPKMK